MIYEQGKIYNFKNDGKIISLKYIAGDFVDIKSGVLWDMTSIIKEGLVLIQNEDLPNKKVL